jgi:hypothetical protein
MDGDFEKWNNQLNDLKPRLLNALGFDSVRDITSKRSEKAFPIRSCLSRRVEMQYLQ